MTDLITIARSAPASDALYRSLIRAAREAADYAPAVSFLAEGPPKNGSLSGPVKSLASRLLLEAGNPVEALLWAAGDSDEEALDRVRALIALERIAEAISIYRQIIARNSALRDSAIDARLAAAPMTTKGASVVDLKGRPIGPQQEAAPIFAPLAVRERISFADVGGLDDVKAQIRRKIILPFQEPSVFQRFRKKAGGGVLMYGPPGCGKTMLARATAGECGAAFINVEIPEILDMYIGESEKRLAAVFAEARQKAPAVLFFDEIEALAAKRRFGDAATGVALVSTFLAEMDGFGGVNEGVLTLAATNVPWAIDSAFRRHGRFDRFIFVPPPDAPARREILIKLLMERPQSPSLDIDAVAKSTGGFTGADLASLVEEACDLAIEESLKGEIVPITPIHLIEAQREVKATTIEWLTSARNYAKYANQGGLFDDVVAFLDKHGR
ncbi:MAG: ATP-binding protein [Parvularculaceae bacterium]|nr:ATP-binding protein [Parvularculaceae bacterium]